MSYDRRLVLRSWSVSSWFRALPVIALVPACVVSFNDYAEGDLRRRDLVGGQSGAATGNGGNASGASSDGASGGSGAMAGNESSSAGVSASGSSGSGSSAGSDAVGGGSGSGTGGSGGTSSVGMAGEGGAGNEAGAPSLAPVTVDIVDIVDSYVSSNSRTSNYGEEKTLIIDRNNGAGPQGMQTHDAILLASLEALPAGAEVSAATLTLSCSRAGDPLSVSYVNAAWQELAVNWYNKPVLGAALGSAAVDATAKLNIDLRSAVVAWLAGDQPNFGVYLSISGLNANECSSSEADDARLRPRLSVTYSVP